MASPQLKNGYIKIANELLDAFAKKNIGGKKRQLLDFIIRKTYGFNKKQDRISLTQFSNGTGITIRDICRCLNQLVNMKIIIKIQDAKGNIYSLNKDYDQWTKMTLVKNVNGQKVDLSTDKNDTYKRHSNTKDNSVANTDSPKSQFQEIVDFYCTLYKEEKGINYFFTGADGKAIKNALNQMKITTQEIKSILMWYIQRPDFDKFPAIKSALSGHFINVYRLEEKENE